VRSRLPIPVSNIALVDLLEKEMAATRRYRGTRQAYARLSGRCERFCSRACDRRTDRRGMGTARRAADNAGAPNPKPILEITERIRPHHRGEPQELLHFIHACAPIMLKQDTGGRIISISSINALSGGVTSAVSSMPMPRRRPESWA